MKLDQTQNHPRVLVVDDSPLVREMIIDLLRAGGITSIAEAGDGFEAIRKVELFQPDLVTMDIEMPGLDGLAAIEAIMNHHRVPILVVTSRGDAHTAFAAISKGALDIVEKPEIDTVDNRAFVDRVRSLARVQVKHRPVMSSPIKESPTGFPNPATAPKPGIVAIASSAGGPQALQQILSGLSSFPLPIVIAQHVAQGFSQGMAEWLTTQSNFTVRVGRHGERLQAGIAYLAPPEYTMTVTPTRDLHLGPPRRESVYHPSANALLESVAMIYGRKSIGVILSGMGTDGVIGICQIKEAGGWTIAQDELSCLIFGMPQAAIDSGSIDHVLPPGRIAEILVRGKT